MTAPEDGSLDESSTEEPREHLAEGGTAGTVGALGGTAAAASGGAAGDEESDSVMPQEAPDPSIGPD